MKTGSKKLAKKRVHVPTPKVNDPSARFANDLETRGEAVELAVGQKLPPGATHALIKKPDGTVVLKRGRFTLA
jgi:hypothetical protein